MIVGLSSYSLIRAIRAQELDFPDALSWAAAHGASHFEVVPMEYNFVENEPLVLAIASRAAECGIALSSYTIGANFLTSSDEAYEAEIARVCREVDVAGALGVTLMRHDLGSLPPPENSFTRFERDLPRFVHACQSIADYAKKHNITTSVENHGYYIQAHERIQRLVMAVDRENFRTTLDIGNFIVVDEDPLAAVKANLPLASMVHFKDFYRRPPGSTPGQGWFTSQTGYALRGAILGHGDLDIPAIAEVIRSSGYKGFVSLEFEGLEECRLGAKIGLENLRRYLSMGA